MQRLLAERGQHRAPSIPDLLIAAAAELNQRTVLHLDKDFDLIAELTARPSNASASNRTTQTHADRGKSGWPIRLSLVPGRPFIYP